MRLFFRSFRRFAGQKAAIPTIKPTRPRWRPFIEALEDRNLLSISLPTPGTPGPVQVAGTSGNDQFVIRLDPGNASNIQFSDNGGSSFQTASLSDVTSITVSTLQGNDVLTIDNGNGLVAKAGSAGLPIAFTGGPGIDVLVVKGDPGGGASISETFSPGASARAGTLTIGNGTVSDMITLTDVSAIIDTLTANSLTVNVNDNNNVIDIDQGPSLDGLKTVTVRGVQAEAMDETLDDRRDDNERLGDNEGDDDEHDDEDLRMEDDAVDEAGQGFLPITFANKTHVTVAAAAGEHLFIVNVSEADPSLQTLAINGGSGFSVVVEREVPAGVALTVTNVQRVDMDDEAIRIDELFAERLDREARPEEVAAFEDARDNGLDDRGLVRDIEESPEGRTQFVKHWYKHYLGRDAVNGEEQGWVRALLGGATEEQVLSAILNSQEFFNRAQTLFQTGNANENFIRAVYQVLLNRTASSDEVQGWLNALSIMGRQGLALDFLLSQEFRAETIGAFYNFLLHRQAGPSEVNAWASSPMDLRDVREAMEESGEFLHDS
jgi:hypothetical protein